ncbi:hypothetical protein B7P43_G04509 [Cryptotermes secundus]|uniref:Uncharacterized protein n=1 Tax=Cryptotermes secundus TaxID=105785 RepID=A0A2J7QW20_9NEOP|nr:hypothetical protein B7P43_G04509 [Cryptotermes secundus]
MIRDVRRDNIKSKRPKKLNQRSTFEQCESQYNLHRPYQATTATNMEYGSGSYQKSDIKCCQIPTIINGYIDPPQMNDPRKSIIERRSEKASKMKRDHKVVIYGDSHARGLSSRLKDKLLDTFEVTGYTKPNCELQTLLSNRNQEIASLSNKGVLVVIGGTNDLISDNSSRTLWHISQFVKQNTQTNIVLLTIPHRYDQTVKSYINEEIMKFNRKLWKYMKLNKHVTILEIPQDRDYFTRHGLHLNGKGKEIICTQLSAIIGKLFQHIEFSPITLGWENNQDITLEKESSIAYNDLNDAQLNDDVYEDKKEKEHNEDFKEVAKDGEVIEPTAATYEESACEMERRSDDLTQTGSLDNLDNLGNPLTKVVRTSRRLKKPSLTKSNDFLW